MSFHLHVVGLVSREFMILEAKRRSRRRRSRFVNGKDWDKDRKQILAGFNGQAFLECHLCKTKSLFLTASATKKHFVGK